MRSAAKNTLLALAVFFLLTGGFALWTESQVRSLAATLMDSTARLLGSEIAAVISEPVAEQLLQPEPTANRHLSEIVARLTLHSDIVAAASVVNASGRVVASNDIEVGRQVALPEVVFGGDTEVQFLRSEVAINGGEYHLFFPLRREQAVIGYLRLAIANDRIGELYQLARRQLLVMAAVGLAVVGALGFLFQLQQRRLARSLEGILEAVMRGEVLPPGNESEFTSALDAARKVGKELSVARAQSVAAERRLDELMRVTEMGVVLVGPDYRLDFVNEKARSLFGCASAAELDKQWQSVRGEIEACTRDNPAEARCDVPTLSGLSCTLDLYRREGKTGWLILVRSREMLDALENELRLAVQMRGFAQFYLAFVHDLKAPLNAMVLNLELLKSTLGAGNNGAGEDETHARQTRYIRTLVDEVSRLDRSLRTVLTHATLPDESHSRFDLRELVEELGSLLSPQAKRQKVAFSIDLPDEAVPLYGQRDRLKQALLNVAINGLESMPSGGAMTVAVESYDGRCSIAIRDTGPGIPPEILAKIYHMHFTTKDGGTGIGLYVARSVVQSQGGEIRAESTPGNGTCFHVDLPLEGRLPSPPSVEVQQ